MKKHMRIWTFLLVMLMSLTLLTAQAESALPSEVADLFTVKAWAHYAIANQPDMPENKAFAVLQEASGYEAALLVMSNTKRAGAGGKIIRTGGLENHHAQLGRGGAGRRECAAAGGDCGRAFRHLLPERRQRVFHA